MEASRYSSFGEPGQPFVSECASGCFNRVKKNATAGKPADARKLQTAGTSDAAAVQPSQHLSTLLAKARFESGILASIAVRFLAMISANMCQPQTPGCITTNNQSLLGGQERLVQKDCQCNNTFTVPVQGPSLA